MILTVIYIYIYIYFFFALNYFLLFEFCGPYKVGAEPLILLSWSTWAERVINYRCIGVIILGEEFQICDLLISAVSDWMSDLHCS